MTQPVKVRRRRWLTVLAILVFLVPAGLGLWLTRVGFDRWREEGGGKKVLAILFLCAAAVASFALAELVTSLLN